MCLQCELALADTADRVRIAYTYCFRYNVVQCPKCSADMDHIIENNREIDICTNCKGYYRSYSYEESSGSKFDDTKILQIDGSIITGLLVFLSVTSSLIPIVSGPFGTITAIIITAGVIFPFAISAIMILSKHIEMSGRLRVIRIDKLIDNLKKYSVYAGNATFWGFVYLMGAIVVLFIFSSLSLLSPTPIPSDSGTGQVVTERSNVQEDVNPNTNVLIGVNCNSDEIPTGGGFGGFSFGDEVSVQSSSKGGNEGNGWQVALTYVSGPAPRDITVYAECAKIVP